MTLQNLFPNPNSLSVDSFGHLYMSAEVHQSLYFSLHLFLLSCQGPQIQMLSKGVDSWCLCFIILFYYSLKRKLSTNFTIKYDFCYKFFVDKLFSDKRNSSLFLMYWVLVYITTLNECWILKCFFIYLIPFPCSSLHCWVQFMRELTVIFFSCNVTIPIFFWSYHAACRILVPQPGIELKQWQGKHWVLSTGSPGNSLVPFLY